MIEAPAGERVEGRFERVYRAQGERLWQAVLAFSGHPEVANDAVAEASPGRSGEGMPSGTRRGGSDGPRSVSQRGS